MPQSYLATNHDRWFSNLWTRTCLHPSQRHAAAEPGAPRQDFAGERRPSAEVPYAKNGLLLDVVGKAVNFEECVSPAIAAQTPLAMVAGG
jgi:hypothetical protein